VNSAWKISVAKPARKQLAKLSGEAQLQITEYLRRRVAEEPDPRRLGKALTGDFKGFWRYRVGDYRIICELRERELLILVVKIDHRREIYR
jgi:mRNA interferase RelE/StbE